MYTLQNDAMKLTLDDKGGLTCLERTGGSGNVIVPPAQGLFRLVMKNGENWEDIAFPKNQDCAVSEEKGTLRIVYENLRTKDGVRAVRVELFVRLDRERLIFDAEIKNEGADLVTDFYYPCIGGIASLAGGRPDMLWPACAGQRIPDVVNHVVSLGESDTGAVMSGTYPGSLSMQWTSLVEGDEVLYYAGHDDLFHAGTLRVTGTGKGTPRITIEKDTMGFVRRGTSWRCPSTVLMLYEGSWRKGAEEYRSWCGTWRKPVEKMSWIREMNGYFLVINKQQYGDDLWPYGKIPELYDMAKAHGCDTLGLFGWYHSGHDNQYPDLEVSESLGGEKALKENIARVQKAGGHVTLYFQGHLMDTGSRFYQEKGKELEGRTRWNTPYLEEYSKYGGSDFEKYFSKKLFATVCPSCLPWHDLMAEKADWVASFGPDGVLYDQIGGMPPYPCFNDNHPHEQNRQSLSYTQGRLKLLKRIHEQVRKNGIAFMTEHETDVYSQFPDALHGIGINPGPVKGKRWQASGSWLTLSSSAPEMFRYCFPETILTLRNPNPFLDPRYVNFAFLYGFRFEMELRYLRDREEAVSSDRAEWRDYARKVGELRSRHKDVLLLGEYLEELGVKNANPSVMCSLFAGENRSALALWNDTEKKQPIDISVEGMRITGWESISGSGSKVPASIDPGTVMTLFCE